MLKIIILFILKPQKVPSFWILGGEIRLDFSFKWILRTFCTALIYPDFISKDKERRIIADAKYKPIDNIGNRDYLQVLAYMLRFEAKTGYYLYPEENNQNVRQLLLNRGITYEGKVSYRNDVYVEKYGLKIPVDANNYDKFKSQMKLSENELRSKF